jgi:hypothetical protein
MKRYAKLAVAMTVASIAVAWMAFDATAATAAKAAAQRKEVYMVVQIGDDISVIAKSQQNEEQKRVALQYKDELKAYEQAKKEATKNKEKGELVKPVKHIVKILKNGLKSQQEAEAWKAKYLTDHGADTNAADTKPKK